MKNIFLYFFMSLMVISCGNATKKDSPKPDISEAKDALCWLKSGKLEMYEQYNKQSTILWKFSQGEVLHVLDSKTVKNKPWLQVKFTGEVKIGYEEFLKIEGTPDKKVGWMQGTVSNLVSCK